MRCVPAPTRFVTEGNRMNREAPAQARHRFELELPGTPGNLRRLRAAFGGWLTSAGVGGEVRGDLVLTMSELASASLGGPVGGRHRLRACAWNDDDGVVVEVVDDRDPINEAPARSGSPAGTGRELAIVATLAA